MALSQEERTARGVEMALEELGTLEQFSGQIHYKLTNPHEEGVTLAEANLRLETIYAMNNKVRGRIALIEAILKQMHPDYIPQKGSSRELHPR